MLVLVSLSDGAKHGYAIQTDIEQFSGVHLGPGTLYGALSSLERDGLLQALPGDRRRRPYQLTVDGRQRLRQQLNDLDRVRRRAAKVAT